MINFHYLSNLFLKLMNFNDNLKQTDFHFQPCVRELMREPDDVRRFDVVTGTMCYVIMCGISHCIGCSASCQESVASSCVRKKRRAPSKCGSPRR